MHGTHVRLVTDADRCGPTDPAPCDSDGLVTNVAGLPIFCFTADCVPLLLHDPVRAAAGAVHGEMRAWILRVWNAANLDEVDALTAAVAEALGVPPLARPLNGI